MLILVLKVRRHWRRTLSYWRVNIPKIYLRAGYPDTQDKGILFAKTWMETSTEECNCTSDEFPTHVFSFLHFYLIFSRLENYYWAMTIEWGIGITNIKYWQFVKASVWGSFLNPQELDFLLLNTEWGHWWQIIFYQLKLGIIFRWYS